MSEENNDNNGQEENDIDVYDDNAYMFGNGSENNSAEAEAEAEGEGEAEGEAEAEEQDDLNQNEQKESIEYGNEVEGLEEAENNEEEDNNNFLINNKKQNIQNPSTNIKKDNEISFKKKENNEINLNNNIQKLEDDDEEENEGGEEEEGGEENIPLVTLKYIAVCQCCKSQFDSKSHLPYLFKCGHFFCKECIEGQFTDEEGIKCPIDGLVAKNINEFKLLNNLITDETISSQRANQIQNKINNNLSNNNLNNNISDKNTCLIHKGQKLTHIVGSTKELVCVYCAFDLVRKNPKCEVREIKEKFEEYISDADKLININHNNIEIIQNSLKDIKKNKEREENNINTYFEHVFKYLTNKKNEFLSQIDSIFTDNATKLSQKLENFSNQIEQAETLKNLVEHYENNNNGNFSDINDAYIKMTSLNNIEKSNKITLHEYKFNHDDETKILKYINNLGNIKTIFKYLPFQNDNTQEVLELTNDNNNNNFTKNQRENPFIKKKSTEDGNIQFNNANNTLMNNNYYYSLGNNNNDKYGKRLSEKNSNVINGKNIFTQFNAERNKYSAFIDNNKNGNIGNNNEQGNYFGNYNFSKSFCSTKQRMNNERNTMPNMNSPCTYVYEGK